MTPTRLAKPNAAAAAEEVAPVPTSNAALTEAQLSKVRQCRDLLDKAAVLVNDASVALCDVPGFAAAWRGLDEPHESIRRHLLAIDRRIQASVNPQSSEATANA